VPPFLRPKGHPGSKVGSGPSLSQRADPAATSQARHVSLSAVVINPARTSNRRALRRSIVNTLAADGWAEPLWLETTHSDRGDGAARAALAAGAEVVFVCGGDGTVGAVASALADSGAALAMIPSGTGNLLALNLGVPGSVVDAVRLATRGGRRQIDLGRVEGRFFTVATGIGLDAQMLAETPRRAKHRLGWPAYAAGVLRHLLEPRFPTWISLDGGPEMEREVRSVLVANVGRLPGGIHLLRAAAPDDGMLDVALISPSRILDWARLLASFVGRKTERDGLETFQARRVEIRADGPQPREVDGDPLPPGRSLVVEIRTAALTVCVAPVYASSPGQSSRPLVDRRSDPSSTPGKVRVD